MMLQLVYKRVKHSEEIRFCYGVANVLLLKMSRVIRAPVHGPNNNRQVLGTVSLSVS